MPNPFTLCGRTTPETALRSFLGWPARRVGGLRPSSTLSDTPRCAHMYIDHPPDPWIRHQDLIEDEEKTILNVIDKEFSGSEQKLLQTIGNTAIRSLGQFLDQVDHLGK
jgi:hypothetical protein